MFYSIKPITLSKNKNLLIYFLNSIPKGKKTFRYFENRSLNIISNHIYSCMKIISSFEDIPVAYGHLELEKDKLWLGVSVADNYVGKGFGESMMLHLIKVARKLKITNNIYLSLDEENFKAKKLYEKLGFIYLKKIKKTIYMIKTI